MSPRRILNIENRDFVIDSQSLPYSIPSPFAAGEFFQFRLENEWRFLSTRDEKAPDMVSLLTDPKYRYSSAWIKVLCGIIVGRYILGLESLNEFGLLGQMMKQRLNIQVYGMIYTMDDNIRGKVIGGIHPEILVFSTDVDAKKISIDSDELELLWYFYQNVQSFFIKSKNFHKLEIREIPFIKYLEEIFKKGNFTPQQKNLRGDFQTVGPVPFKIPQLTESINIYLPRINKYCDRSCSGILSSAYVTNKRENEYIVFRQKSTNQELMKIHDPIMADADVPPALLGAGSIYFSEGIESLSGTFPSQNVISFDLNTLSVKFKEVYRMSPADYPFLYPDIFRFHGVGIVFEAYVLWSLFTRRYLFDERTKIIKNMEGTVLGNVTSDTQQLLTFDESHKRFLTEDYKIGMPPLRSCHARLLLFKSLYWSSSFYKDSVEKFLSRLDFNENCLSETIDIDQMKDCLKTINIHPDIQIFVLEE